MTVTLLVLSRADDDGRPLRRAQLDLLLRSRAQNWPESRFVVIDEPSGDHFHDQLKRTIRDSDSDLFAFATDDGVFYRRVDHPDVVDTMSASGGVICYSLRLGENTTGFCYPTGETHRTPQPGLIWRWPDFSGDAGYPGSVDGHVFRADDLRQLLNSCYTPNPTSLEVTLNERIGQLGLDWMTCDEVSSYVAVPVNRVSSQSGVRHGTLFPQPIDMLNERFDRGERIDLERSFAGVTIDAAHVELEYQWAPA